MVLQGWQRDVGGDSGYFNLLCLLTQALYLFFCVGLSSLEKSCSELDLFYRPEKSFFGLFSFFLASFQASWKREFSFMGKKGKQKGYFYFHESIEYSAKNKYDKGKA